MNSTLNLTTFGTLSLLRDGLQPGPAAGQRRPLALLAILADAGGAALSRKWFTR